MQSTYLNVPCWHRGQQQNR